MLDKAASERIVHDYKVSSYGEQWKNGFADGKVQLLSLIWGPELEYSETEGCRP